MAAARRQHDFGPTSHLLAFLAGAFGKPGAKAPEPWKFNPYDPRNAKAARKVVPLSDFKHMFRPSWEVENG